MGKYIVCQEIHSFCQLQISLVAFPLSKSASRLPKHVDICAWHIRHCTLLELLTMALSLLWLFQMPRKTLQIGLELRSYHLVSGQQFSQHSVSK